MTTGDATTATPSRESVGTRKDYHALNAMLNMYDCDGRIQLDQDREAVRQYFLQHVIPNTVVFPTLEEKICVQLVFRVRLVKRAAAASSPS